LQPGSSRRPRGWQRTYGERGESRQLAPEVSADDIANCVRHAYETAGYGEDAAGVAWGPLPETLDITMHVRAEQLPEDEAGLRHLSDDQAICVGYANALIDCEGLPPAHWLARKVATSLHDLRKVKGAGQVGPDGKVLMRVARNGSEWRPLSASISLHHHEDADWMFLDAFAHEAVEGACAGLAVPSITLNGAGMFACGGPNGDNGQTGKKLVMDAYGPTVPIGGGAWSGKDFWKADRRGGMLARCIAQWLVWKGSFAEVTVTLEYRPGSDAPSHASAVADGQRIELDASRLTADVVVPRLHWAFGAIPNILYPAPPLADVARWGHHGQLGSVLFNEIDTLCGWRVARHHADQARKLPAHDVHLALGETLA
jgi:S-adenosylmethionine synthetase